MRTAALCAGYGGLELGLTAAGFDVELVWHSEIDAHASQVMAARFPESVNLGDLTQISEEDLMTADLRRNDVAANRRWALYASGMSLEQVADVEGVSRQTVFGQFKRRGWHMRPKPSPKPFIEFNGSRYTMRDSIGYYGKTNGDRTLLHRDVWEHHNGPIPPGHDIHHIDHDRTNNDLSNLEAVEHAEHARRHAAAARKAGDPGNPTVDVMTAGFP